MNQENFITQRIAKAREHMKKLSQDNCEKEMTLAMFEYMRNKTLPDHLTAKELKDLEKLIEKNLKEIESKIAALTDHMLL